MASNMDVDFAGEPFPELGRPVNGSRSQHVMALPNPDPVKEVAAKGKKTWPEIIKYVKQTRKLQAELNAKVRTVRSTLCKLSFRLILYQYCVWRVHCKLY